MLTLKLSKSFNKPRLSPCRCRLCPRRRDAARCRHPPRLSEMPFHGEETLSKEPPTDGSLEMGSKDLRVGYDGAEGGPDLVRKVSLKKRPAVDMKLQSGRSRWFRQSTRLGGETQGPLRWG